MFYDSVFSPLFLTYITTTLTGIYNAYKLIDISTKRDKIMLRTSQNGTYHLDVSIFVLLHHSCYVTYYFYLYKILHALYHYMCCIL